MPDSSADRDPVELEPTGAEQTGPYVAAAGPSAPVCVGEFRILRHIGQGGMGVVYETLQESLGRHVVLKLLPAEVVEVASGLCPFTSC
jgi:serine/threonine protein kinase